MNWLFLAAIVTALVALRQSLPIIIIVVAIFTQLVWNDGSATYVIEDVWNAVDNTTLLSIPMFLLAGAIMSKGSLAARLINIVKACTTWLPGGLAVATVLSCAMFAAISGSSTVTMLAMGAILYPTLIEARYSREFSLGALTSAGTLGIIIPPSIPLIIFGIVNEISIVDLFTAGIIPGLLLVFVLATYSFVVNRKLPAEKFDFPALIAALRDGVWSMMLPVIMLGGIYSGWFSPTEAAAVAVAYAIIVEVFIHRDLGLRGLWDVGVETSKLLGTLIPIIAVIISLQHVLTVMGAQDTISDWVAGYVSDRIVFLLMVNLLLLVVGCFVDPLSAILLLSPILLAPAVQLGIDPLHFAIVMVINLEIGLLTPPVGLNLIVAMTAFREKFSAIVKGALPFVFLMIGVLLLVTFVPNVSLMLLK